MSSNINNISNINEHVTDVQANPKTNDFKSMNSSDFTQNYGISTAIFLLSPSVVFIYNKIT